jgi:RNA polymerase sigma factor (sigma-70 family)
VSCTVLLTLTMPDSSHEPIELAVDSAGAADLDALFRLHYGRLVRALTLASGDRELAADAVQEAFVKAHLRWKRLQHYDDPVGWIRRVAINRLRDGHRRSTRKLLAMDRLRGDAQLDERTSPDATHDAMSRRTGDTDGVMAMLRTLPRQQRICIALFHVDGLPIADIASSLGISEGAVKFHLHQGRERLRGNVTGPAGPWRDEGSHS